MKPLTFDLTTLAPASTRQPEADPIHVEPVPYEPETTVAPAAPAAPAAPTVNVNTAARPAAAPEPMPEPPAEPSALTAKPEKAKEARAPKRFRSAAVATTAPTALKLPRRFVRHGGWAKDVANEQLHALATHVLARHTEEGLKTIAITSALPGEGKTTIALGLAERMASAGRRILVIDLDTHRRTLSGMVDLEDAPGAFLANGEFAEQLHYYETDCTGVFLMPAGQLDPGMPLMRRDSLERLVGSASTKFDLVLLDCPPLVPVADAHVIGDISDAAILVVRASSTPQDVVDQALSDFGKEKFIAAVLNRAKPSRIPYFGEIYGYYSRGQKR
ncbi:MAG: CpsD/CapB family tyrosine-protein kinase [Planctomycetota bacterium]